jgi:hypothetical protein
MATFPIDYVYLKTRCRAEGVSMKDVSRLLGHGEQYLSYKKTMGYGLPNEDVVKLQDLLDIDMKKLILKSDDETVSNEPASDMVIENLIKKIGELEHKLSLLEEQMKTPVPVSIPMNADEMAILVMGDLLEGGWCSKDDVLVAFNKHHIPIEYITKALKAHNAISATSGVADKARTFYIKQPA